MPVHTKSSKYYVLQQISGLAKINPQLRILDLGCGRALNFLPLLQRYPTISYTGIEPNPTEAALAKQHLAALPLAQVHTALAYTSSAQGGFDVVVSLSVLEHVKNLERFLAFSVQQAKSGGQIIHLYDLGHSLSPSSLKERLQVWICNRDYLRRLVPETKVARYIDLPQVQRFLDQAGAKLERVTHHNLPDHVRLIKQLPETEVARHLPGLTDLELLLSPLVADQQQREQLFPAVCIWARKP